MFPGKTNSRGAVGLLAALCLLAAGCDSSPMDQLRLEPHALDARSEVELSVAGIQVLVDSVGGVRRGRWKHSDRAFFLFDSGLWLVGQQGGTLRASLRARGTSNYRIDPATGGVYLVRKGDVQGSVATWPAGAPRDPRGNPRLFGDAMAWARYVPHPRPKQSDGWPSVELYASPLEDVTISLAVYGYDEPRFDDVVFVRYEIHNTGEAPVENAYVGFQTDVDLDGCAHAGYNSTGFLPWSNVTYTYPYESRGDVIANASCPTPVVGFTFLESPLRRPGAEAVTSHPIYRKNNYENYRFSEIATTVPREAYWLLQGRSTMGEPMIDPTTDEETRFAFTGDPVEEEGWLDVAIDVRSLLGAGPFTLSPGETRVLTVVFVINEGAVLSGALSLLYHRVRWLRENPQYWKF